MRRKRYIVAEEQNVLFKFFAKQYISKNNLFGIHMIPLNRYFIAIILNN